MIALSPMAWSRLERLGGLVLVAAPAFGGCAEPAPPVAPASPAPARAAPAPTPAAFDPPVQDCDQDAAAESPIASGQLGEGPRVVRLFNNAGVDIQARILNEAREPAIPGTLVVVAGATGEFHVAEGVYLVRYRLEGSCEVRRGEELLLTGPRAGVEISIKPTKDKTSESGTKKVPEPL